MLLGLLISHQAAGPEDISENKLSQKPIAFAGIKNFHVIVWKFAAETGIHSNISLSSSLSRNSE